MQSAAGLKAGIRVLVIFLAGALSTGKGVAKGDKDSTSWIHLDHLAGIEEIIQKAISKKELPGAVVLVGHKGQVIYRRAFGHAVLYPKVIPMREDTLFDVASLTKVVATTSAIMKLFEEGKLALQDPVEKYFPEFGAEGKSEITLRDLLTHYSGLRPDVDLYQHWSGYAKAVELMAAEKPIASPRTRFIYSDINFEVLGEVVRRVSGEPLNAYVRRKIFLPLAMKETQFRPSPKLRSRIAATEFENRTSGKMLWGVVHDPTARRMEGVAGHAGLFSTVDDLAVFAQMILNRGTYGNVRIFSPLTVKKMTTVQSPLGKRVRRGLGWDIDSNFSRNRGELFPLGSFGHTGFTGTSIWIDPRSQSYIIFLSNRVHPEGEGSVLSLRGRISTLVAAALDWKLADGSVPPGRGFLESASITSLHERVGRRSRMAKSSRRIKVGLEVLKIQKFRPISGKRVGLVTNHTGLDSAGNRNIDLLMKHPGVTLGAIFTPEHGLEGTAGAGESVASSIHPSSGVAVYSLYGDARRPTQKMLKNLDALIFDIQDVGARFYTYITTLGYVMEAAAESKIPVFVLDRPNPLGGILVEGPRLESSRTSFVGYFPLPVRHGMTVAELARLFNQEKKIGCDLRVIPMEGWRRDSWFDQTDLRWVNPSPNIRNLVQAILYPGVALLEGANVSVGRGTDTPFELVGAPWMDESALARHLNSRGIPGVSFIPVRFTPRSGPYQGEECRGVNLVLLDREELNLPALGLEMIAGLYHLFSERFEVDRTLPLVGAGWVIEGIKAGRDSRLLQQDWQQELDRFRKLREKYLLYP